MANPEFETMGGAEQPAHIKEALANLDGPADSKERVEEAEKKPDKDDLDAETKKRMSRQFTFNFEWPKPADAKPNQRVYKGTFTNTFASIRLRRQIGISRAELARGVEFDVMDPFTREIILVLAHLQWTLDTSANPDDHWSRNLEDVDDYEALQALYAEVVRHEATFLGRL